MDAKEHSAVKPQPNSGLTPQMDGKSGNPPSLRYGATRAETEIIAHFRFEIPKVRGGPCPVTVGCEVSGGVA